MRLNRVAVEERRQERFIGIPAAGDGVEGGATKGSNTWERG